MRPKNRKIYLSGDDAIKLLSELELVLISLRRIGDA